jgi:hypothetical protein
MFFEGTNFEEQMGQAVYAVSQDGQVFVRFEGSGRSLLVDSGDARVW